MSKETSRFKWIFILILTWLAPNFTTLVKIAIMNSHWLQSLSGGRGIQKLLNVTPPMKSLSSQRQPQSYHDATNKSIINHQKLLGGSAFFPPR